MKLFLTVEKNSKKLMENVHKFIHVTCLVPIEYHLQNHLESTIKSHVADFYLLLTQDDLQHSDKVLFTLYPTFLPHFLSTMCTHVRFHASLFVFTSAGWLTCFIIAKSLHHNNNIDFIINSIRDSIKTAFSSASTRNRNFS